MHISRERAANLGHETVAILRAGSYMLPDGNIVQIGDLARNAAQKTVAYPPGSALELIAPGTHDAQIEVRNETTLAAARRLTQAGERVVALNFASAKHPGGGFLSGARAQEESIARSSGLFACLENNPMYDFHNAQCDAMYSDYALFSPDVLIFRDDDGWLLEQPYLCSFITAPAPNAKVVLEREPNRKRELHDAMKARILKVLAIAAMHDCEVLILGAWGCGAFGNDPQIVAPMFRDALSGPFRGVFRQVLFSITDWSKEQRFIGPFQRAF